jgi:hypothetical protein
MTTCDIALQAKKLLIEMTELKIDTVSSMVRNAEGCWQVTVELIEMNRIPNSTDMLATYEVTLDDEGKLMGYQRSRRYLRNHTMEEDRP